MKTWITGVLIILLTILFTATSYAGWVGITDGKRRVQLTENSSLPVTIQDQYTPPFIIPMSQYKDDTPITVATALDDYTLTLTDTTNFIDGTFIVLYDVAGSRYWFGYQVGAPIGQVITVDRPLDYTFQIGDVATAGITNMAVDGSDTPQIFRVRLGDPGLNVSIDIVRIIITIYAESTVNLSTFGDIEDGLTNGVTLRRVDGYYYNIFNVKTNGDISSIAYDTMEYASTNPQQGQDGLVARLTFGGQDKMGVVLRIGANEDLQLIINDDLTDLTSFVIMAEGSIASCNCN